MRGEWSGGVGGVCERVDVKSSGSGEGVRALLATLLPRVYGEGSRG